LGVSDCEMVLSFDPTWVFSDGLQALLKEGREQIAALTPTPHS